MLFVTQLRRWLVALACCAALVVLCVAFVDRPLADYSREIFGGTDLFQWIDKMFVPMELAASAAVFVITSWASWRRSKQEDLGRLLLPVQAVVASAIALLIAEVLKFVVGRSQVYPLYIISRIYEFHPFHGGMDYEGFPSATMSVTVAIASVLWIRSPRLRMLWALVVILLSSALIITNGHWLGDIVGGVFLGGFIGWWVVNYAHVSGRPASQPPLTDRQ